MTPPTNQRAPLPWCYRLRVLFVWLVPMSVIWCRVVSAAVTHSVLSAGWSTSLIRSRLELLQVSQEDLDYSHLYLTCWSILCALIRLQELTMCEGEESIECAIYANVTSCLFFSWLWKVEAFFMIFLIDSTPNAHSLLHSFGVFARYGALIGLHSKPHP